MNRPRGLHQALLVAGALLLAGCGPTEPVRIGYLGGLSGRVTDLGIGGLNGARLAVEQRNAAGGVGGRPVELVEADDQQDPQAARQAMQRLLNHRVAAIIGPMTSAVALAVVPLANESGVPLISPTVTTNDLSAIDDAFLRVIPATRQFVRITAGYHYRRIGLRRVQPIYDLRNRAYCESWVADFRQEFSALGGEVLAPLTFSSGDDVAFGDLARAALAGKPDAVALVANSVDAAMLAQRLRRLDRKVALVAAEWAMTERLIELGGQAVEGLTASQLFDRQGEQPAFLAFRQAYVKRFGQYPGFASVLSFDATNVALDALSGQKPGQTLKQALLEKRRFPTLQGTLEFDAHGDVNGGTFMATVLQGVFVRLPDEPAKPAP